MDLKFLDFEQPIAELEAKIEELRYVGDDSEININEEVSRLKEKSAALTKNIFAKLSPWQVARVARHESRPYTQDYLDMIAPDFQELHGDRMYALVTRRGVIPKSVCVAITACQSPRDTGKHNA